MRTKRILGRTSFLAFFSLMVGCIPVPKQKDIHVLNASHVPEAIHEEDNFSLFLGPVKLNSFIGKKGTVLTSINEGKIILDQGSEWAMPLSENISIVFLTYLHQIFPNSSFYKDFNFFARADYRLSFNFHHFNPHEGNRFYAMVNWRVSDRKNNKVLWNQMFNKKVPLESSDMDSIKQVSEDLLHELIGIISNKIHEHEERKP